MKETVKMILCICVHMRVPFKPIDYTRLKDSKGVRRYIACQGPMKNTSIDMWQMVLDQNVVSIVMLCQTTENNKVK